MKTVSFRSYSLFLLALLFFATSTAINAYGETKIAKPTKSKAKAANPYAAKAVIQLKGAKDWVTSVTFSPDGKLLAVGSYERIQIFDAASHKELKKMEMKYGYVRTLAFSPDGKTLAAGGYQTIITWNPVTGAEIKKYENHTAYVGTVMFSKDGKRLLSAGEDQTVRITDVAKGIEIKALEDFDYPVYAATWSPDEKMIATASGDKDFVIKPGHVKLWDAETGKLIAKLDDHLKAATGVVFSVDGKILISTSEDENANVYDVTAQKALGRYPGHQRPVNAAIWIKKDYVISAGGGRAQKGNLVKIWDRNDATELATLKGHRGRVTSVALAPDGKTVVSGSYDGSVILWDISKVMADPEKTKKFIEEQKKKKAEQKAKKQKRG